MPNVRRTTPRSPPAEARRPANEPRAPEAVSPEPARGWQPTPAAGRRNAAAGSTAPVASGRPTVPAAVAAPASPPPVPAAPIPADARAVRDEMGALATRYRADPGSAATLNRASQLVGAARPRIDETESKLAKAKAALGAKEADEGFLRRALWDTPEVDQLQRQVGGLERELAELKAARSAGQVLLRAAKPAAPGVSAQEWRGQLDGLVNRVHAETGQVGAPWAEAVGTLAKKEREVGSAAYAAEAGAGNLRQEVGNLKEVTPFYDRWEWLDKLTAGESTRGWLYRQGELQGRQSASVAKDLGGARDYGEARVQAELARLLRAEDPAFRVNHDRLQVLTPARNEVRGAQDLAGSAQRALQSARDAVSRRDWVRSTEPMTRTEDQLQADGTTQQVESSAYRSWRFEMDSADSAARSSVSDAESQVNSLNRSLPQVQQSLSAAEVRATFGRLDPDIYSAFPPLFSSPFSWTSYESGRIDDLTRDIGKVEGRLSQVSAQIEPEYQRTNGLVSARMDARRSELER